MAKVSGNWQNKFKDFAITNMILFGSHNLFGMNTELGSRATNLIVNEDNSSKEFLYEKPLPGGFFCCDWNCSSICTNTCKSGWFWTLVVCGVAALGTGGGLTAYYVTKGKAPVPGPTPGPTPVSVICNDTFSDCPYVLLKGSLKSTLQSYNLTDRKDFCFGQMSPDEDKYGFIFNDNKYCTLYTSLVNYGEKEPLFYNKEIKSLEVVKLPKNCNSTAYMFVGANKLQSINLENINTENITDTSGMFLGTSELSTLTGFDKLNFTKVIDTSYMFASTNLQSIDLTGFKESNVKIADGMFFGNKENIIEFTNLKYIGKDSLQSADFMFSYFKMDNTIAGAIKEMDTSNLVNASYMFSGIQDGGLTLDLSTLKTSKIKNAEGMFMGSKLDELKLADFTSLENAESMFEDACFIKGINGASSLEFKKLNNVKSMFEGYEVCTGATETISTRTLDLSGLDTSNIKSAEKMFSKAQLDTLTLANFGKLENATMMFKDANIGDFTITSLDLSSLKYADSMFEKLKGLSSFALDLSELDSYKLSSVKKMFFGSECITYTLKGFKNLNSMAEMFADSKAETINLDEWNTTGTSINTTGAFNVAKENPTRTVTVNFEISDNAKIKEELRSNKFSCTENKEDVDTCTKDV